MSQHGFRVLSCPVVGKHFFPSWIVGIGSHEYLTDVGPRFDPVSLRAGQYRVQHRSARPCLLATQEEPILPTDRLLPKRSFRRIVINRQTPVFSVTP